MNLHADGQIMRPVAWNWKMLLCGLAMWVAAGLTIILTPKDIVTDHGSNIDLETMIPKEFGDWRADERIALIPISPDVQEKLNKIYASVFSKTYVNTHGDRIMLSIAYGPDQNERFQVHLPESCYPAQGFSISQLHKDTINLSMGDLPVMRLFATQELRKEPLTYWVVLGGKVVRGKTEQKLTRLFDNDRNRVSGGFIIRVSTIGDNPPQSYKIQDGFINDFLGALSVDLANRFTGGRIK